MSSPIASQNPSLWKQLLVGFHQHTAHGYRIQRLSQFLGKAIAGLFPDVHHDIRALDVGCGDMTLAEAIAAENSSIEWTCTDIHKLPPHLSASDKWRKYRTFDGINLPFAAASFDVVLFADVLHHCLPQAGALLCEAARVGRFVVIKDHFEQGWYSRQLLRMLDFIGNYGYGVSVPDRYFNSFTFSTTSSQSGLRIVSMKHGVAVYPSWLSPIFPPGLQFIAILAKSSE